SSRAFARGISLDRCDQAWTVAVTVSIRSRRPGGEHLGKAGLRFQRQMVQIVNKQRPAGCRGPKALQLSQPAAIAADRPEQLRVYSFAVYGIARKSHKRPGLDRAAFMNSPGD